MSRDVGGFWWQFRARDTAADATREPLAARGRSCRSSVSRRGLGLAIACLRSQLNPPERGPEGSPGRCPIDKNFVAVPPP
jgi:hypothetical protein